MKPIELKYIHVYKKKPKNYAQLQERSNTLKRLKEEITGTVQKDDDKEKEEQKELWVALNTRKLKKVNEGLSRM
ncbi:MAG: hypothetical protein ACRC4H_06230 [Plesiomonas sp.]